MPVEVRREDPFIARPRGQRVAGLERHVLAARGRDRDHLRALVDTVHGAGQVAGQEARPARQVQGLRGLERQQHVDQRRDVLIPAGTVALLEQPRPQPPVVVLRRPLGVVLTHRRIHHPLAWQA